MTVAEAQQRISSREFSEWMAFNRIEPFGADRMDIGFAIVAATVANSARSKKGKAMKLTDFLPTFSRKPEVAEGDMKSMFKRFADKWPKGKS